MLVSEKFRSIQGEGASQGAPAVFVRLMRCNLSCSFCDTPYTWDFERYSFEDETTEQTEAELVEWIERESVGRLIWTGGEPLIQQKAIARCLHLLDERADLAGREREVVEVETNLTVRPIPELLARVDQWNLSPKLASSGQGLRERRKPELFQLFAANERAFFKFVVLDAADCEEMETCISEFQLARSRVILMPEARTPEQLRERQAQVAEMALSLRVRFSSRVHLELFGGKRGH